MTERLHCLTRKVATPIGSVFVHMDFDNAGRAQAISISQNQKFEDTAVGQLLDSISRAANEIIGEVVAE